VVLFEESDVFGLVHSINVQSRLRADWLDADRAARLRGCEDNDFVTSATQRFRKQMRMHLQPSGKWFNDRMLKMSDYAYTQREVSDPCPV
jgi:hypothetical protein